MWERHEWWQSGVIYQIYPRSFQDSDGDGIGDLNGIRKRLTYLEWLGVDAIWISPIYPSPMADFGYDVANYVAIDPMFGTLDDFDSLLREAHDLGIRVILDFVPNHTSDQHPWFLDACSSRESLQRDWYIWRDPAPGGGPPNNWLSVFGGSAWEWHEPTGQYYYHAFLKEQPDLNWRNPEVQEAMLNSMRFWLDRGVDGFRVDVIYHVIKDAEFRDNPPNPNYLPSQPSFDSYLAVYSTDRPEVHDVVEKMRSVMDEYPERMLVGEVYLPLERCMAYYGSAGQGAHMPFNFQLVLASWNARSIQEIVDTYENALPSYGWPNWVLGNHDQPRMASRVGSRQTRVATMLLLTLRGTPTMYYGDEIGMENVPIPAERVQDPFEKREPGNGRDPQRTPMQWDTGPNAGFTTGKPWLPIPPSAQQNNVEALRQDPYSILTLVSQLLHLRKNEPALSIGDYISVPAGGDVFAFRRSHQQSEFVIVLNLGSNPEQFTAADISREQWQGILNTAVDDQFTWEGDTLKLRPDEGVILRKK